MGIKSFVQYGAGELRDIINIKVLGKDVFEALVYLNFYGSLCR
jgi:hypothetical protein